MSDAERDQKLGGDISVAFFLLGVPACLVIGVLTDVVERKRLLVMTVLLGQGPCALTLLVTQYWQLYILRTLTAGRRAEGPATQRHSFQWQHKTRLVCW
jgi:MFS family permease